MRFLVDENLPPAVSEVLQRLGHDVRWITRTDLEGASDGIIWQLAATEERILITRDLDFPRPELPAPPGMILLRLPGWFLSSQIASRVEEWIKKKDVGLIQGKLWVVGAGTERMRDLSDA